MEIEVLAGAALLVLAIILIPILLNSLWKRSYDERKKMRKITYDLLTNIWAGVIGIFLGLQLGNFNPIGIVLGAVFVLCLYLVGLFFLISFYPEEDSKKGERNYKKNKRDAEKEI